MRVYIPVTPQSLSNQQVDATNLAWMDNPQLRNACEVSDWGAEEYEDLALTQAAMYSMTLEGHINLRMAVAVELSDSTPFDICEEYPGAIYVKTQIPWRSVRSIHLDDSSFAQVVEELLQLLRPEQITALIAGEDPSQIGVDNAKLDLWDCVLDEMMAWYDPVEVATIL